MTQKNLNTGYSSSQIMESRLKEKELRNICQYRPTIPIGNDKMVSIRSSSGKYLVNIRCYKRDQLSRLYSSKRGIMLTFDEWKRLKRSTNAIDQQLLRLKREQQRLAKRAGRQRKYDEQDDEPRDDDDDDANNVNNDENEERYDERANKRKLKNADSTPVHHSSK